MEKCKNGIDNLVSKFIKKGIQETTENLISTNMLKEMAGSFKKSFEDMLNFGEHRLNFAGIGDIGDDILKNIEEAKSPNGKNINNSVDKNNNNNNNNNNKANNNGAGVEITIKSSSEQELRIVDIDNQIKDFNPSKATRLQKGNYGELLTEKEMYDMGDLENIMLDDVSLKNINDKTHQGIDLIFKNNTPPPEIVIVESKYKNNGKKPRMNKNRNQNTKYKWKRQMDDKWVSKNLEDAVGQEKSKGIEKLLKQDKNNYKLNGDKGIINILKIASLVNKKGDVKYFEIGREGEVLRELSKIDVEQILKN